MASRPSYRCAACGHHVHPMAGTIFERSSTPLRLWFRAASLIAESKGTVTAKELERELGVTYKTAWRMGRLIRAKLAEPSEVADPLVRVTRNSVDPASPPPAAVATRGVWEPGVISTFAGDGTAAYGGDGGQATAAQLRNPYDVAVDLAGNVFIADEGNHAIRKVDASGVISTVAGNGTPGYSGDAGPAVAAQLRGPSGVAVDDHGNLLIADHQNHVVRRVDPAGTIVTVAGTGEGGFAGDGGPASAALLDWPGRILPMGDALLISDYCNNRIRRVDGAGIISTFAGNGSGTSSGDGGPAASAGVVRPNGLALDADGNLLVAQPRDPGTPDARVRMITPLGAITTFAGGQLAGFAGDGGPAVVAWLANPHDVITDGEGGVLIADLRNNRIRRVDPSGTIWTVVGTGHAGFGGNSGLAGRAQLHRPAGLALTPGGDLLVADSRNNRVRRVSGPIPEVWRRRRQGISLVHTGDRGTQNGSRWPMPFPFASP